MRNVTIAFFSILSLFSLILNVILLNQMRSQNRVVEVVDGDTFQLVSGKRVRLMGVDAPEYNRCGGPEARRYLTGLILNKQVALNEEQQETYGRSLALVYESGRLINRLVLEQGFAVPDYRKNSQRDALTAAYHKAKTAQNGIFALCKEQPDAKPSNPKCVIKGNIDKNTYKKYYHLPGCRQYNQIVLDKDIGEQYFCSEKEAEQAGFVKAAGCP